MWHIDDDPEVWAKSEVNNTPAHQHVDIVEANGKQSGNTFYYKGVPFPGANHVTSHAFVSWDGDPLLDIDSIAVADSVVTFVWLAWRRASSSPLAPWQRATVMARPTTACTTSWADR